MRVKQKFPGKESNANVKKDHYVFHCDPGHGWIEVPIMELIKLKLLTSISNCSYKGKYHLFLEEDCDLPKWRDAHIAYYGTEPEIREQVYDEECFVRELPSYFQKVS